MAKTDSTDVHPLGESPTLDPPGSLEERFRELVRTHGPSLARLTRVHEFDAALREDLMQEILVALWRGLARFRGESSLRTWVHRVAHNVALKHRRGRGRARGREAEYAWLKLTADSDETADPAQTSEDREAVERLLRQVASLPASDRQLVVLYLEGMTGAEIAEISGLSKTNVSSRLHRLRARLRAELEPSSSAEARK